MPKPHGFISKLADDLGIRVIEAKRPMIVSVNATDVQRARSKRPTACAMARACKRSHPEIQEAFFFKSCAYLQESDKITKYLLPSSVQKEIVAFDRAREFEPGNYHLSPVSPSQRRGVRSTARPTGTKTGKGSRSPMHRTTNVRKTFTTATQS